MTHLSDADLPRRQVIQGALWATPAILLATALPAAASSGASGRSLLYQIDPASQGFTYEYVWGEVQDYLLVGQAIGFNLIDPDATVRLQTAVVAVTFRNYFPSAGVVGVGGELEPHPLPWWAVDYHLADGGAPKDFDANTVRVAAIGADLRFEFERINDVPQLPTARGPLQYLNFNGFSVAGSTTVTAAEVEIFGSLLEGGSHYAHGTVPVKNIPK